MRYLKKMGENVVVYHGPAMGDTWYKSKGWLGYNGTHSHEYLAIVDGEVVELPIPEVVVSKIYSRRDLRAELMAIEIPTSDNKTINLWDSAKAFLDANDMWEELILSHDVAEEHPGFIALMEQVTPILESMGLDPEEMLERCIFKSELYDF